MVGIGIIGASKVANRQDECRFVVEAVLVGQDGMVRMCQQLNQAEFRGSRWEAKKLQNEADEDSIYLSPALPQSWCQRIWGRNMREGEAANRQGGECKREIYPFLAIKCLCQSISGFLCCCCYAAKNQQIISGSSFLARGWAICHKNMWIARTPKAKSMYVCKQCVSNTWILQKIKNFQDFTYQKSLEKIWKVVEWLKLHKSI